MRTVVPSATTSLPSGPAGSASPVDAEPAAAFRGRTTGRVALLLGAALVAALPLVVDPSGWFVYLPARWLVLVLTTLCLVLATLWDRRRPEGLPGGRAWLAGPPGGHGHCPVVWARGGRATSRADHSPVPGLEA